MGTPTGQSKTKRCSCMQPLPQSTRLCSGDLKTQTTQTEVFYMLSVFFQTQLLRGPCHLPVKGSMVFPRTVSIFFSMGRKRMSIKEQLMSGRIFAFFLASSASLSSSAFFSVSSLFSSSFFFFSSAFLAASSAFFLSASSFAIRSSSFSLM